MKTVFDVQEVYIKPAVGHILSLCETTRLTNHDILSKITWRISQLLFKGLRDMDYLFFSFPGQFENLDPHYFSCDPFNYIK